MINLTYFKDFNSYDSEKESLKIPNLSYINVDKNNQPNIYIVPTNDFFMVINYEIYDNEQLSEINDIMSTYNGSIPLLMRSDLISEAKLNGQDITDQLNKDGIHNFTGNTVDEKLNELQSLLFKDGQPTNYVISAKGPISIGTKFQLKIKFKPEVTEAIGLFYESLALKSVDREIFINNPNIKDFTFLFYNCKYLNYVNDKLFFYNLEATDFKYLFYNCYKLSNISYKLFKNNINATTFRSTFYGCSGLTNIPNDLFNNNAKCNSFYETFYGCSSLTNIPNDLFFNNTVNTSFYNTFANCTKLTIIPEHLFDNNALVTFFLGTFDNCTSLTSIPEKLFYYNTNVTDFHYTFRNCSGLTGTVPTDSDGTPIYKRSGVGKPGRYEIVTGHKDCFLGCTGLTDYSEIPEDWGGPEEVRILTYTTTEPSQEVKLVNFQEFLDFINVLEDNTRINEAGDDLPVTGTGALNYTFAEPGEHQVELKFKDDTTTLASGLSGCIELTSIPENLFSNCTDVTDFNWTFSDCYGLTNIPANLFSNNTAVTDFTGTFHSCTKLTSIPENLFSNNTAVTNFSFAFSGCGGLTSIPENLFSNNTAVTNFRSTFTNCDGLTSIPEKLFSNNSAVTNFSYAFQFCYGLTGNVPVDNDGTPIYNRSTPGKEGYAMVSIQHNCFYSCTGLTDYSSIPTDWK